MKGIQDMRFHTVATRSGKYVGKVDEFPQLKTREFASRLDAIDSIIELASEKLQEIHERMGR